MDAAVSAAGNRRSRVRHALFDRAKRLQQAQRNISIRRILPGNEGDLLAQRREIQSPIDEQQESARRTHPRGVGNKHGDRKTEARKKLKSLLER